ncbi:type II secretion system F family protein [Allopusillimonas ginsengisoli]|uniref:type II secretion system F family protein n=1 Tax=Allopusillimonas ginsengisoli TaxID=453575 RepID=UPI00101EF22F|nr:type II secretion system F family protein [Allopusillimonas ginsengisoli]TEA80316.1 type II secretion protein F [Allopusillimonas ginsengisoli]
MPIVLALIAVALLLLLGGILLWHQANRRARRDTTERFVNQHIDARTAAHLNAPSLANSQRDAHVWRGGPANWSSLLLRAGVVPTPGFYIRLLGLPLVLAIVGGVMLGPLAAGAILVMALVLGFFRLWLKADKRHHKAVEQLPEFLDAVVRMMTIGNSLSASFQNATGKIGEPLLEMVERANSNHRGGQELDVALRQTARLYGLHELYLVAAIVGVTIRFGGRSDHVLERMAAFMRDLTQARRELVALSAEVRLSAWVLALLPLGIGAFIVMFNNALFMSMWHDPVGWKMLVGAAALQIIGSYWLYRMARLA